MSIASKINLLIASMAILASILLTIFVGQRDFSFQRDEIALSASSLVGSQPHLQLTIYTQNESQFRSTAKEILGLSPAVRRVALYDNQGSLMHVETKPWATPDDAPFLERVRTNLSPTDRGMVAIEGGSLPAGLEPLAFLTLGERTISLTTPIVSALNASEPGLSREDFAAALADPTRIRSRNVIGYVEVGLSTTMIWSLTLPTIAMSAGVGLLVVFAFWLLARMITQRIMRPLTELARVADDIAAGKRTTTVPLSGSGEVRDIAGVLNGVITGLQKTTVRMDADRKILNLKVDERTQQLSAQQVALSQATKEVSETRDRMRHLAYFDTLTSLPNRRLFTEQLILLLRLAARAKQNVGLLIVDIDNFKRINDSFGASTGDRLLKIVGERLTEGVRDSDVLHRRADLQDPVMDLSRMAGDEFAVVLNNVENTEAALKVAERLADAVAQPADINGQEIIVTCSVGTAIAPEHAKDVDALLRAADAAMLSAKKNGRNRIVLYNASMDAADRERLKLETDLRKAIDEGQFLLHYQPQVHARTGEVCGAEALVRWEHPKRGILPPSKWIPVAEDLGIVGEVGQWVLNQACADLQRFRTAGLELPKLSVNVSALQLTEEFIHAVGAALSFTGLPADSLELELTEGVMVSEQEKTLQLVQRLKDLGVRLSIDDFGTGYSSLSYLTRLPLDELKIDRSFVTGLNGGGPNVELVRAIVAMAKSLGLGIVVEGVERLPEVEFFRQQDVHVIQGFLFSAPVPEAQFRKLLAPKHFAREMARLYAASAAGPLTSA